MTEVRVSMPRPGCENQNVTNKPVSLLKTKDRDFGARQVVENGRLMLEPRSAFGKTASFLPSDAFAGRRPIEFGPV